LEASRFPETCNESWGVFKAFTNIFYFSGSIVIGSRNNERIIDRPLETLNNANISAVVTSARAAELLLTKHPNVFTTAPDISSVAEVSIK